MLQIQYGGAGITTFDSLIDAFAEIDEPEEAGLCTVNRSAAGLAKRLGCPDESGERFRSRSATG